VIKNLKNSVKSKILLFGEYAIMFNAKALSIPYEEYGGELSFRPKILKGEAVKNSNISLKEYLRHLADLNSNNELLCKLDLEKLDLDINNGLVFDSTIPQGFGLGSSGALIAAIYDRYCIDKIDNVKKLSKSEMKTLKAVFANLESYFHGNSSGLDPLISYLRRAVLVSGKEDLDSVNYPEFSGDKGGIFLLNTGQVGETQPLVKLFLDNCQHENYFKMVKEEFVEHNNQCIEAFLNKDLKGLFKSMKSLSKFALQNLSPMIPKEFRFIWKNGLKTDSYYLKLCGSGGGGFILGFAEDISKAKKELKNYNIKVIKEF
jgi:mevalonate kinase